MIAHANAQEEEILSLTIKKNMGYSSFGDEIQGDFTITGSGPENIQNLTLFFNGTQVAFESSNQLTFRFDTEDYPLGLMNITLKGEESEGAVYTKSIFREFVSPTMVGTWIGIISGLLVLLSLGVYLVIYLIRKQREKRSPAEKLNRIKIDLDKKFR